MKDEKASLWEALYKTIFRKLTNKFPDYIKNTHNQERKEKYLDAAINYALGFSDIAVYGKYINCTEPKLYESGNILHKSGIKTPKIPDNAMSKSEIKSLIILSLREQISSAIDEIEAAVGKNGQIHQNNSIHKKQTNEITQNRKFSGPAL